MWSKWHFRHCTTWASFVDSLKKITNGMAEPMTKRFIIQMIESSGQGGGGGSRIWQSIVPGHL